MPDGRTVDSRHHRLGVSYQIDPVAWPVVLTHVLAFGLRLEYRFHVRPGAETAAGASHHDRFHIVFGVGLLYRIRQLPTHVVRPGVEALWPIQRDHPNRISILYQNSLITHCFIASLTRINQIDAHSA